MSELEDRLAKLEKIASDEKKLLEEAANRKMSTVDKARLVGQGATLGFADEIIAGIRSLSPNVTYEDALFEERKSIERARQDFPLQSLGLEGAGGVLTGLATAPLTGGASIPTTLGRLATIGAVQGGTYGFGTGEGGVTQRLTNVPINAAIGLVANPVVSKTVGAIGRGISSLTDKATRYFTPGELAKPVEDEVRRIVQTIDPDAPFENVLDDVIERVGKGELIGDMSDSTRNALRALYANSTAGGKNIIRDKLVSRADASRKGMETELDVGLRGDNVQANVLKAVQSNEKTLKAETSNAYNRVFTATKGQRFPQIDNVILGIASQSKASKNIIAKKFDDNGLKPIFKTNKDGSLSLTRSLTLKEGEIAKRAFMDAKGVSNRSGASDKANTMGNYETEIVNVLDEISPDLKATRAKWASIEATNRAFEDGKRIFGKSSDEVEIIFEDLLAKGQPELIAGFRTGVASQLKNKLEAGGKATLANKLSNIDAKERKILEIIYPQDTLEGAINKIDLASKVQQTKNVVLGGSQTAITEAEKTAIGSGNTLANTFDLATGNVIAPLFRLASDLVRKSAQNLTPDQQNKVVGFLVSENAETIRDALTDERALAVLRNKITDLGRRVQSGASTGTTVGLLGAGSEPIRAASSLGTSLLGVQ